MLEPISLVIQAGGQSRRMGTDKARISFLGQPLIQRVVERLAPIAGELLVTTNHPQDYTFLGLPLFTDLLPGGGALGGLYTALSCASSPIVLNVACDLPFASAAILQHAARLLLQEQADVVIPRSPNGLEPLHAAYRRLTCLPMVRAAIESKQLKLIDWFPRVRVLEIPEDEIARLDPSGLAFLNINTPEDLSLAEKLALSQ